MRPDLKFRLSTAFLMSLVMSIFMSGAISLIHVPLAAWPRAWLEAWLTAWPIAFAASIALGAPVAKLAMRISGFPPRG